MYTGNIRIPRIHTGAILPMTTSWQLAGRPQQPGRTHGPFCSQRSTRSNPPLPCVSLGFTPGWIAGRQRAPSSRQDKHTSSWPSWKSIPVRMNIFRVKPIARNKNCKSHFVSCFVKKQALTILKHIFHIFMEALSTWLNGTCLLRWRSSIWFLLTITILYFHLQFLWSHIIFRSD